MASRPRLSVAASKGGTSGFGRWLMAIPQYAMAQPGSVSGIAENVLIVSGKKNECSMARARSNCFCASGEHEVWKSTRPSFSAFPEAGLVSAQPDMTSKSDTAAVTKLTPSFMASLLCSSSWFAPAYSTWVTGLLVPASLLTARAPRGCHGASSRGDRQRRLHASPAAKSTAIHEGSRLGIRGDGFARSIYLFPCGGVKEKSALTVWHSSVKVSLT